jgi:hypothetical protein
MPTFIAPVGYTNTDMLRSYLEAEKAVLAGQAVRLGDAWRTMADLEWILEGVRRYRALVNAEALRDAGMSGIPVRLANFNTGYGGDY